jgi:NADPH-dependent curcumin reductase CurA
MSEKNLQVLLARRPKGAPQPSDFEFKETPIPDIGDGQVLVRNHYLSLDPYMRGRMNNTKSYAKSIGLGEVMVGGTVGEVVKSRHSNFKTGDKVLGGFGWQLYGVSDGTAVQKVDDSGVPLSAYLGVLGMPGLTAWVGLIDIGQPKSGETVVVSAASGAVGSVVGQIAKIKGCRAVGIAGGPDKCRYVVEELGFDACVDYKAGRLAEDLEKATPNGIDINFENVGGEILDTVLRRLNAFARIPLCGLISQYNLTEPYGLKSIGSLLLNRVKLQGFIVFEHQARHPVALKDLMQWVREGRIKYRESVVEGLKNAPAAFIGLLNGKNFGKQLVKLV